MGRLSRVGSPDGVALAVEEWGDPHGRAVVFLHGIAQSRHAWRPLLEGQLARGGLRLLAVDLRGHGDSDAPTGREAYGPGRLGEDLRAVVQTLERPTIVAWSYAGVAIGEYLRAYGGDALGGVMLVAAATSVGKPAQGNFGPVMMDHARALTSEDPAVYEAGARPFVAGCASGPVSAAFVEEAVTQMLRVPAVARRALLSRSEDFTGDIAASSVPLAIVHGTEDRVVLPIVGREASRRRPDARFTELAGVGHLPWVEAPDAFLAALHALVG